MSCLVICNSHWVQEGRHHDCTDPHLPISFPSWGKFHPAIYIHAPMNRAASGCRSVWGPWALRHSQERRRKVIHYTVVSQQQRLREVPVVGSPQKHARIGQWGERWHLKEKLGEALLGWIMSSKIYGNLKPVYMNLFMNRVFATIIRLKLGGGGVS